MLAVKTVNHRKPRASAATKGRMRNRPRRPSSKAQKANYRHKVAAMKVFAFYILDLHDLRGERRARIRTWKNHIRNYWKIVEAWTATHRRRGKKDKDIENMSNFVRDQIKAGKSVQACLADLKERSK